MTDERLRGAARAAREGGEPAAEVRLLRERVRAGEVGEGLELLAGLGHAPAREVLGLAPLPLPLEVDPWLEALAGLPPPLRARAAAGLAWETPIECRDRFDGPDDAFLAALDALDRCLLEPDSSERAERLAGAIGEAMQASWGWSTHHALAAIDSIRALLAEPFSAREHLGRVHQALEPRLTLERMQEVCLEELAEQLLHGRDPVLGREARLGRWFLRVPGIVRALAVSPDGSRLLVTHMSDGGARLVELPGGQVRPVPHEGAREVWDAAALPGGWLTGDSAGRLRRLDGEGQPVWSLEAHDEVRALAAFHEGTRALTGGTEGAVAAWDLVAGRELWRAKGHARTVAALAASPDGRLGATADADGRLVRWDLLRQTARPDAEATAGAAVSALGFLDPGRLVVVGGGLLEVWDPASWAPLRRLEGAPSSVHALALAPPLAVVLGGGRGVQVWDLDRGVLLREGIAHAVPLAATFLPGGRSFLVGSRSGAVRTWAL